MNQSGQLRIRESSQSPRDRRTEFSSVPIRAMTAGTAVFENLTASSYRILGLENLCDGQNEGQREYPIQMILQGPDFAAANSSEKIVNVLQRYDSATGTPYLDVALLTLHRQRLE